ncbi:unnamed protein product [Rhizophagus irregularis]|nr:unnamed protein product [Rhizophagus irregularis]
MGVASFGKSKFTTDHEQCEWIIILRLGDMVSRLGLRSSRFDIFWNELNGYFNEHNNTVVNERRADTVLYIPYIFI